jgi:uncharacterized protein (DUF1501 family)
MSMTGRREFLRRSIQFGVGALASTALPGVSFATLPTGDRALIVVLLRGALDGLSAVPPYGDPQYAAARGPIAIPAASQAHGALDLDGFFGLHPAMPLLHDRWQAGELLVAHAVASPYRERSHFDGQNVLENGGDRPSGTASGWLNRALVAMGGQVQGLALGQNVPLILRGPAPVGSWAPSGLPEVEPELITRLRDLYSGDPTLSARLDEAMHIEALADASLPPQGTMGAVRDRGVARLKATADAAAHMIAAPGGPRVAVFDATGWDTHAGEGAAEGQLAARLRALDQVLDALRAGLGAQWSRTAVLVCTEFGRTVQVNGTRGTDHGTGTVALLLGGAVHGGRMQADWPGLADAQRYQGRDLRPTLDLRALAKGLLRDHLGVGTAALGDVFPGSAAVLPVRDLLRA